MSCYTAKRVHGWIGMKAKTVPIFWLDGRIHKGRFDYSAGGVGRNICEALGKLGCLSHFISTVGDDLQGRILLKQIPKESSRFVAKLPGENTAQCIVVLDRQGDCSFLMGDMSIHSKISVGMIQQHEELIKNAPLIVMDGNLPEESMNKVLQLAQKYHVPVFYEPTDIAISEKPFTTPNWKSIRFVTPNLAELKHIATHLKIANDEKFSNNLDEAAELAQNVAYHIENVIVTLGPNGVLIARRGKATDPFLNDLPAEEVYVRHYPVIKKNDFVNVSGAGDCFASGLIAGVLQNVPESRCVSVGFAAAEKALYSQSAVPTEIFDRTHRSWEEDAKYITLI